jgi:hypothetical protein
MSDTLATLATAVPSSPPDATPSAAPAQAQPAASSKPTPGTPEWSQLTTEQRHAALRGPPNPRARGHSPAVEQREAAAARAAGEPPKAPDVDPAAPPAHSVEKLKVGKYEVSEAELAGMLDRQSQDDLRKATVPATPQDYKLAIPETMQLPGGVQFKFDEVGNKAAFDAARAWAHNKGFSQSDFSEMLGLYASQEAQQHVALAELSRREIAKAGANGPQRVDAVGRWITGTVGEADAKPIRATIVTDAHLRFYEKLMQREISQGGASFSQQHRAAPDNAQIPGYDKMSFEQRRYAQDQLAARRR